MKPLIGIMPLYDTTKESIWMLPGYQKLIEKNGGIPIILPFTEDQEILRTLIEKFDGLVFTGGQDISPEFYNEDKKSTCGETLAERDEMEVFCLKLVIELDKPSLGICRGIQLLNVVNGGTLYQDLPTEFPTTVQHQMTPPYDRNQHKVYLEKDTPLSEIFGKDVLSVNSYHHQAIKDLGENLSVAAVAEDQLVEAVYMPEKKFILAVQWHPEFFDAETIENQNLIASFLSFCVSEK